MSLLFDSQPTVWNHPDAYGDCVGGVECDGMPSEKLGFTAYAGEEVDLTAHLKVAGRAGGSASRKATKISRGPRSSKCTIASHIRIETRTWALPWPG
jgi:hypothetical protein